LTPLNTYFRGFFCIVGGAKYQLFARVLFKYGVYMSPLAALHSVTIMAHTDDVIEFILAKMRKVLTDV